MTAVDTSALLAIILREPTASSCKRVSAESTHLVISAGTLVEALIVSSRRNVGAEVLGLIEQLKMDVAPVTMETAKRIGRIYSTWGKGIHPAALNLGDCFAYDVARERDCPLLYVGGDFAKTDIRSAL